MFMWKSEVNEYWASFSITLHLVETGSPLTLKLINWIGLASQQAPGSSSLFP